jgi:hypothetical protein
MRRLAPALPLLLILLWLNACERAASSAGTGSGSGAGESGNTPGNATGGGARGQGAALTWDDATAGAVLVVDGSNASEAAIIFPHYTDSTLADVSKLDTAVVRRAHVDLFSRAGPAGQADVSPTSAGSLGGDCTAWPTAHVRSLDRGADGVPAAWTVGFLAGNAVAIAMDSMQTLAPVDSARRAAEIARVASSLPNDTSAAVRGLPFVVRSAGRLILDVGDTAIVAEVVRQLNQEANPQEEHIFLIAERDSVTGKWVPAYSERVSGAEDDVESAEVLAAVRLGPRRVPTIVVSRDYGDGGAYTLIERVGPATWRVRWNSAYTGC